MFFVYSKRCFLYGDKNIYVKKFYISESIIAWLTIISISAFWSVSQERKNQGDIYLEDGRNLFNLIVTTREWNARLGGIYAPISDKIQPNPYLDLPNRDITTIKGEKLTLLNPAYMTRMIAELANERDRVNFHITSLKPIRPANVPRTWEAIALKTFEKRREQEYSEYFDNGKTLFFRYMAPLVTQQSCLKCHEKQGYKVGDIRGGISVSFPATFSTPWVLIFTHIFFAILGSVAIFTYGSKLNNTMQVLENLSMIDGLTVIFNRRYFDEYITREFLDSKRSKHPLSIGICDIDNFKLYNDTYGHPAGDECLKAVAQTIDSALRRPGDIVARYGGEEFVVVLPSTPADGALAIGNLLCTRIESLRLSHTSSQVSKYVTVSIGMTTYYGDDTSLKSLLNFADQSLYKAKSNGKNRVEYIAATVE